MKEGALLMLILTVHGIRFSSSDTSDVERAVDIVLPCIYVLMGDGEEEGKAGGLALSKERVTLVLRSLTVIGKEEELETITTYQLTEDTTTRVIQVSVNLDPLTFASKLLHADCEGEEVVCEISPLSSAHLNHQFYITHIHLKELSISMVTRPEKSSKDSEDSRGPNSVLHEMTAETLTVAFMISSTPTLHLTAPAVDVSLNCEVWGDTEGASVEWHLQKEGKGQRLDPEEGSRLSIVPGPLKKSMDVSLTIKGVRVQDEGTYICAITSGPHKVQQILQLKVREPPQVTMVLSKGLDLTLICRTDRYYPLDVEVSWLLGQTPVTHTHPVTSSHRRNSDGTYNLSTHLKVTTPTSGAPPDIYTCTVSHISVPDPITATTVIHPADEENLNTPGAVGLVISTLILLFTLLAVFMFKLDR
ncbi:tapasin-related protein [Bombina bombina]|uniref:tapasin-related protein n=1 Tax=Bombina bombina TaxID=8345 RepID=UPI00235B234E|nr:tapasin-related protein [Bombina bombina]